MGKRVCSANTLGYSQVQETMRWGGRGREVILCNIYQILSCLVLPVVKIMNLFKNLWEAPAQSQACWPYPPPPSSSSSNRQLSSCPFFPPCFWLLVRSASFLSFAWVKETLILFPIRLCPGGGWTGLDDGVCEKHRTNNTTNTHQHPIMIHTSGLKQTKQRFSLFRHDLLY